MAKKNKGYIPLWRDIQDNWIWQDEEPFDRRSAWIDLLLSVNHEERKLLINNQVIVIKPGQKWTSYRTLARQWNWSKDRVRRYIKLLKSDGMIYTDETRNGTLLTIVNWENFTIQNNTKSATYKDTDEYTSKDTGKDTDKYKTIMNKNVNNDKERKEKDPAPLEIEPPTGGGEWQ